MAYKYYINSSLIPSYHVLNTPKYDTKISFNEFELVASELEIVLDNKDTSIYDDRVSGSLFHNADFFRWPVEIYDDEQNIYIWKGRIQNIKVSDKDGTLTINTTNYIQDLATINCVYDNSTHGDETPAEAIYNLLIDTNMAAIPSDDIIFHGFQDGINIQDFNDVFVSVYYSADKGINLLTVIAELCRITQAAIYPVDNKIHYIQWQQYDGEKGLQIQESDIVAKSYSHEYDYEKIYNDANIAYDNSGTATYTSTSNTASITQYGKKSFNVPNADIGSTSNDDFNIIITNVNGAIYCRDLAITRSKDARKIAIFDVVEKLNYLKLGEIVLLNFNPFINEPVRIIGKVKNRKDNVSLKVIFLNHPIVVSRDTTPPDKILIDSVFALSSESVIVRFSKSFASDLLGYKLYFTSSNGEWEAESSHLGYSPIDIKNPSMTLDGYCYVILSQLSPGATYYFKAIAYDTSYNYSDESNVVSCFMPTITGDGNAFNLTGYVYLNFTIDDSNPLHGSVPDDYHTLGDGTLYGEENYQPPAYYNSPIYYSPIGFSYLKWKGGGEEWRIGIQYKTSDDNITWSSWSTEIDAIYNSGITISGSPIYFQYRFIFHSSRWTDTDYFYIRDIA